MKKWTLYIWEDVLCDYTPGMIVAVARSVEEAREIAAKKDTYITYDMGFGCESHLIGDWEPGVPQIWYAWGGG